MLANYLGLSKKDIFHLYTFKVLNLSSAHPASLYTQFSQSFPQHQLSRDYVYKSIRDMESKGWVNFQLEGKRKYYSLTPYGLELYKQRYMEAYQHSLSSIQQVVENIIYDISKKGVKHKFISLSEREKNYVSKIINIRELNEYVILSSLRKNKTDIGSNMYQSMLERFGWQTSEGYFYEILMIMEGVDQKEKFLEQRTNWIDGKWEDERRRTKRIYRLTEQGAFHYNQIANRVLEELLQTRQDLIALNSLVTIENA